MSTVKHKEIFKDKVVKACTKCSSKRLIAYWDDELEYYIYLEEDVQPFVCLACETPSTVAVNTNGSVYGIDPSSLRQ